MKILFESPHLISSYDAANSWLHLHWQGRHNEADSKSYALEVLKNIRLTRATRVFNDATLDKDGWSELTRWLAQDFMQQVAEAGVVAVAWVLPENLLARTHVHNLLAQVSCPLIDTFVDVEAAYNWLKSGAAVAGPDC
ncbi:hypothetical protein [Hymenobacter psychrophilus]|uniref:SpoIIAA-like n=1 Tax=Hymenobacter psychrophilus TaxID=651662 RepID=A0A1H3HLR0_9BACT|nr:hypothetical protein [Hymenobacter psychrophilus]SDY16320.1 hypothetical protein SAMN04488069_10647 [Hymenobacter psychrophilus]